MSLWTPNRTLTKTDHDHLVALGRGAKSVVEFGPGFSTFAFLEAMVPEIVGLEHNPEWFDIQTDRFKEYPNVTIDWYYNEAPVAGVPANVSGREFDLAFVDSPKGYAAARVIHPGQEDCSRLNTCLAALKLAPVVVLHDAIRPLERGSLSKLNAMGHTIEWIAAPLKWKQQDDSYGLARIVRNEQKQDRPNIPDVEEPGRVAGGARSE
jgi:hypothetical protein